MEIRKWKTGQHCTDIAFTFGLSENRSILKLMKLLIIFKCYH